MPMNIKRIKISSYEFILAIAMMGMTSCTLASLDDPIGETEGGLEQSQNKINGPNTVPNTIEEFETILSGEDGRVWGGKAFTLAGFNGFQDCRLDDEVTINFDGTYLYDGGRTLCGGEDNRRNRKGTWRITDDGANILFDEGTSIECLANVVGLTQDSLSISGSYAELEVKGLYIAQ